MRIKISYSVTLTDNEAKELVKLAKEYGYDYKPQTRRQLIKQILQNDGTCAIDSVPKEK